MAVRLFVLLLVVEVRLRGESSTEEGKPKMILSSADWTKNSNSRSIDLGLEGVRTRVALIESFLVFKLQKG